jgi:diguanylate cyclase (GGDEF)-like protein
VELHNNIYYISQQDEGIIFAQIRRISLAIFAVLLLMLSGFTIFVYYYMIRYARKEILSLQHNSDVLRSVAKEAQVDPLTQAGSRRYGIRQLEAAFTRFKRTGETPLIMLLDVDSFKKINDSYGHAAGDLVLETMVSVIRQNIRSDDSLIRWGGDEFVAIFNGLKKADSIVLANKIQTAVRSSDLVTEKGLILPTVSIGLSYFTNEDTSYNDAIRRADLAMYGSKARGGDTVNACWLAHMA